MSKGSDERYTPKHVLDVVRKFGGGQIGLDPCASPDNWTKATFTFKKEDDGLAHGWNGYGLVFMNPPYSRGQLRKWCQKAYAEEFRAGVDIVGLIPCDLGTESGQFVAETAAALCFPKGRLTFVRPDGTYDTGAKQPSVLPYWGDRARSFKRVFSQLGVVWAR